MLRGPSLRFGPSRSESRAPQLLESGRIVADVSLVAAAAAIEHAAKQVDGVLLAAQLHHRAAGGSVRLLGHLFHQLGHVLSLQNSRQNVQECLAPP